MAIAVSIRTCLAGHRVQFATATEWVARLAEAKRQNSLDQELRRLSFIPLLVVDEVGYIPFDPEAANLMFSLVSARYERASLIVTSNKPFSAWGEIFGDEVTAVAMIDRLVHHAEILALKGDSYRLRDKDLGPTPTTDARSAAAALRPTGCAPQPRYPRPAAHARGCIFNRREGVHFQPALTQASGGAGPDVRVSSGAKACEEPLGRRICPTVRSMSVGDRPAGRPGPDGGRQTLDVPSASSLGADALPLGSSRTAVPRGFS